MSLSTVNYNDPVAFREATLPVLLRAEAENCRLIAIAIRLAEAGGVNTPQARRLWTVECHGRIELVALQKADDLLEVSHGSDEAAACLADELLSNGGARAIAAVSPTSETIASRYAQRSGISRRLHRRYRAHSVSDVISPPRASGLMRLCDDNDRQLLSEFINEYMEAIDEPACDSAALATELIAAQRIFFWCDPEPVAMAAWAGPTPNGNRINSVYTRPQFRNCGYAANLVAGLTQRLLDSGKRSCFLFTDRKNEGAERVYAKIGYRPVSGGEHWIFDQPQAHDRAALKQPVM